MSKNKTHTICAIVVTYNRKQLLLKCLDSLKNQSQPLDAIYIIDNNSSDGTPETLLKTGYISSLPKTLQEGIYKNEPNIIDDNDQNSSIKIYYVKLQKNLGGAGGFFEGLRRAYNDGYDFFWLMDDDVITEKKALSHLLKAFNLKLPVGFVSSKVLWNKNQPHLMNLPIVKPTLNKYPFNIFDNKHYLIIESASFVSLLITRNVVKQIGFPIKDFFIWGDDVEYTRRISKSGFVGIYCFDSIVIHKTQHNYQPSIINYNWRHYYFIRNNLYLAKQKNIVEYLLLVGYFFLQSYQIFFTKNQSLRNKLYILTMHFKGIVSSLFFKPAVIKPFCN